VARVHSTGGANEEKGSALKHVLGKDEVWQEFTQLAAQTKRKVQQTQLAALAPPNQRTKARYMNVDILIQWGLKIDIFLEKQKRGVKQEFDHKRVEEKFGWVTGFRKNIKEWGELLEIVITTENFVRTHGLCTESYLELENLLSDQAHTDQTIKVREELLNFVREESSKAKPGERLLGRSEVIESVFGKLKRLERDQSKSGLGNRFKLSEEMPLRPAINRNKNGINLAGSNERLFISPGWIYDIA